MSLRGCEWSLEESNILRFKLRNLWGGGSLRGAAEGKKKRGTLATGPTSVF